MKKTILSIFIHTIRNIWGTIQHPYRQYRELAKGDIVGSVVILLLIVLFFFFVSPIKTKSLHPLLFTVKATKLTIAFFFSYVFVILLIYGLSRFAEKRAKLHSVVTLWTYSLLPTLVWFGTTSVFFILLPPPRQDTIPGLSFSILYLSFSLFLLWWKGILYYLTLRFGLKLDLKKIVIVSSLILPILGLYSIFLYRFGIFKIPFI